MQKKEVMLGSHNLEATASKLKKIEITGTEGNASKFELIPFSGNGCFHSTFHLNPFPLRKL
ncbi:MAG TPA: hypothetical protein ENH03_00740 [Candidatus Bathyarchaeota archaeon]|nr:hypothetical protein [Candidatus Bathyarchaeota archaeon]